MITVSELVKSYPSAQALKGVSLRVERGEIFGLLGPNGAGKSTLLKAIVGLVNPTAGSIVVDGIDLRRQPKAALAKIGFVPQQVAFPAHLTIREVLAFHAEIKGLPESSIMSGLQQVGLQHDAHRRVGELSGGMRQRLGLAQAILADPPLLVLDEPSVGLDPHVAAEFRDLLAELNARGTTILLTSHLLGEVERLAHRVAILQDGAVLALDTMQNLMTRLKPSLWIKLAGDCSPAQEVLRTLGMSFDTVGQTLRVSSSGNQNVVVLDALRQEGVEVETFWTTMPSLEEVFRTVVESSAK